MTRAYVALLALITIALSDAAPRAQSGPLLPAVDLRRDLRLNGDVWPGDFNGDGITDLVAERTNTDGAGGLHILLGRGDGTFGTPIPNAFVGRVIQVADFNGDRRPDVVATRLAASSGTFVLPGNGNGTLGTARQVDADSAAAAVTADFTGDGRRDLVLTGPVRVMSGNGDLTFGTPVRLSDLGFADCPGGGPSTFACGGGIAGDFDRDGDNDFVVVGHENIEVFVNSGGLLFSVNPLSVWPATDVTARDLNGDGDLDLVVSASFHGHQETGEGKVYVLRGGPGAAFELNATYDVANGAEQVVVGDFTRDGRIDIATANRSAITRESCGPFHQGSDSVSILPGTASGFGAATSFALADQSVIVQDDDENARFRFNVLSLNTSDLDRDGFPDLIASHGGILLVRPPAANRAPVADAGPDVTVVGGGIYRLEGRATEPDHHLLSFAWTGPESIVGPSNFCFEGGLQDGRHTFTLTVDDGNGGIDQDTKVITVRSLIEPTVRVLQPAAGTVIPAGQPFEIRWEASDETGISHFYVQANLGPNRTFLIPECRVPGTARSCTWRNPMPSEDADLIVVATDTDGIPGQDSTGRIFIRGTVPPNSLPEIWTHEDVGAVGAAGTASVSSGGFTVRGSGADIWGTADEFHWMYQLAGSDFEISARVESVQNVHRWVKAGVMIRESSAPGSRHWSLFATPTTEKGLAFQRRRTTNGATVHTAGPALAPPVWLRLAKFGDSIRSYYRKNASDPWTLIGEETVPGLPYPMQIGLAVSSHVDGRLAEARFSNVIAGGINQLQQSAAIGGSVSRVAFDGTHYTIDGSGADIWGTSDAFSIAYSGFNTPNSSFTARVFSLENTNRWAKAGVMIRDNGSPGSPHVMVIVSPEKGVAMQWRTTAGGTSSSTTPSAGAAPKWVRLVKRGSSYTGQVSSDGLTWDTLGTVTLSLSDVSLFGLVVTSHDASQVATAVFDEVRLEQQ